MPTIVQFYMPANTFAWATINDTVRSRHIQTSGSAYYEGETIAASGDGTLYTGDIAIEVRFRTEKVSGLVTNLASEDGEPWTYLYGDVFSIALPTADLKTTASWSKTETDGGMANYAPRPGSPAATSEDSTFAGNLLGTGEDAGNQAVGVWSFGRESNQNKSSYISGGFGAERTESVTGPVGPPPGDGSETETVVIEGSDRKVDTHGTDVTLADGREAMRLLGASLGDGTLTILGQTSENAYGDDPKRLETFQISLATAFDKAGAVFWTNSATQVSLARGEIEQLRDRLQGFTLLDEDAVVKAEKTKLWTAIKEVLQNRVFNPAKIKRARATDSGFVMEVLDALGQKVFEGGTAGTPGLSSDGLADVTVGTGDDAGKILPSTTNAAPWRVFVRAAEADDPAGLVRLSDEATPETTGWAIYKGDLIAQDQIANAIDGDDTTTFTTLARDVKLANQLSNVNLAEAILGGAAYPTRNNASDDAEALAIIDDVIVAMQSSGALADALERGGALEYLNRSEKATGNPEDPSDDTVLASGTIWGRKEARVQLQLGATNYTRFGVWRKEVNKTAANDGYNKLKGGSNSGEGPGAFAYSALPATEYTEASDPSYPGGASATYTGETVALQTSTYYTGLISVTASWDSEWTAFDATGDIPAGDASGRTATGYKVGSLTAVISGLESANGDPLQYIQSTETSGADPNAVIAEADASEYVVETATDIREIIFRAVSITTSAKVDDNELQFTTDFTGSAATDPMLRLVTNIGGNPTTVLGGPAPENRGTAEPTNDDGVSVPTETATLMGTFVGQNVDGPLGVLGRWQLMDNDEVTRTLTTTTRTFDAGADSPTRTDTYAVEVSNEDMHRIGDGTMLHGAFGAEVQP